MLSCWYNMAVVKWSTTPDTGATISFQNQLHALSAVWLPAAMLICRWMRSAHMTRMVQWRVASHLHRQGISTSETSERHLLRLCSLKRLVANSLSGWRTLISSHHHLSLNNDRLTILLRSA